MHCIWSTYGELPPDAARIRQAVFVEEQGFREEFDALDARSWHALLLCDTEVIGTARLFADENGTMHIGRIAVEKNARGGGSGSFLLNACCEKAKELGARRVVLGAQCRAAQFYERNGFTANGELYDDEGCPHQMMEKLL